MGWDAYADPFGGTERPDPEYVAIVDALLADGVEAVDGLLRYGGLDVSTCGKMLERATGEPVWTDEDWDAAKTRRLAVAADWTFEAAPEDEWVKRSARAFLETTARLGRGVRFSF